jgi:plasmid stabilization system protein ParE
MSLRINWTLESEKTFIQNLEYLSEEWNTVVINDFIDRVEEVLANIKSNPKLYPSHRPEENVHKCVIHERITLYYRIVDDECIDLLTFWNTSQDPSQLKV